MDSPYRINNHKKKTPKQKPSTVTENHSKNGNIKPITSKRYKNNVKKGAIISDIHTISGRELIKKILKYKMKYHKLLKNIIMNHFQRDLK